MVLDKTDAIRVDKYMPPSRKGTGRGPIKEYIFLCRSKKCNTEIKSRGSYLKRHSGLCRSCRGKQTIHKALSQWKLRPYESILNRLKKVDPRCNLTYEEFREFTKITECHYCKKPIDWQPYNRNGATNLDRIDNNLAHIRNNLVVCCGHCNKTRGDRFTYDEFMMLAPILQKIRQRRV